MRSGFAQIFILLMRFLLSRLFFESFIIVIMLLIGDFFTPALADGCFTEFWVISKSPQVSTTHLRILADLNHAVNWILSHLFSYF